MSVVVTAAVSSSGKSLSAMYMRPITPVRGTVLLYSATIRTMSVVRMRRGGSNVHVLIEITYPSSFPASVPEPYSGTDAHNKSPVASS